MPRPLGRLLAPLYPLESSSFFRPGALAQRALGSETGGGWNAPKGHSITHPPPSPSPVTPGSVSLRACERERASGRPGGVRGAAPKKFFWVFLEASRSFQAFLTKNQSIAEHACEPLMSDSDYEDYEDDVIICPLCLTAVPTSVPTSRMAAAPASTGMRDGLRASQYVAPRQAHSVPSRVAPSRPVDSTAHNAAGAPPFFEKWLLILRAAPKSSK